MIDLHMHTVYSDGSLQPDELVRMAVEHNLKAVSVTDHDTTESYAHVVEAAQGIPLEIIPGIEINTVWKEKEIHILGYYIDPENESLQDVILQHRQNRVDQIQEMTRKLQKKGVRVTYDAIRALSRSDGTLGRPHVAKAIVDSGAASTISDAFSRYLNPRCETYVRRKTVTPHEAVEAIYESGGIAVIAHPGDLEFIEELVLDLMNYGLRGLEAYHRSHSPALIEFHCSLAEKYGLIVTGGTDFHGTMDVYSKARERLHMPPAVYDELRREHERLRMSYVKAS